MKEKITLLLLTVLLCVAAAGCSDQNSSDQAEQEYCMYYINEDGNQVVYEEYEPISDNTEDMIQEFIYNQTEDPGTKKEEYHSLLPKGVAIQGSAWQDGILHLNLSGSYSDMMFTREIVTRVGLVRTFTQIPGVEKVEILVEGESLKDSRGAEVGFLSEDSFVENSGKEINTYQNITMTLYFANADGTKLVPEERNVNYSSNVPLERFVVEQLIKGPKEEGHYAVLPAETHILSVTISDDICYVNFDDSFQSSPLNVREEIPIYSIVNSLIRVCKVREVQFSINGESDITFRDKIGLDQLFRWDNSYLLEE